MSAQSTPEVVGAAWRRLSIRVVWVDLGWSVLSLLPGAVAIAFFGVEPSLSALWPLALVAAFGVLGGASDTVRWAFTSYRVTDSEVERRTGILTRRHRSLRRDRIRSVDTHARLRHRVAGLRVVTVGAGQQAGAGEAALVLDALTRADAERLRGELLDAPAGAPATGAPATGAQTEVLATLRPWWVVYNMFSIWAYLFAAGLVWGAFWLATTFGVDVVGMVSAVADSLGWLGVVAVALVAGGVVGALGMGFSFLTSYWRFELARVRSAGTTYLRTRRGLFSTREISRDEARSRGLSIGEPLLWRWMGMADTNLITTGLSVWDPEEPTAILPRGPIRVARQVASRVLGEPSPLDTTLIRHPQAALRRRMWWATLVAAAVVAGVTMPVVEGAVPVWALWAASGVWPIALVGAILSYRSLGHAIVGDHLVVRSGLLSRTTTALRRDAVSTVAVRQSLLQRRLGLATVSAMTAAGWGVYEAPDVAAREAIGFAAEAAPGVTDELLLDTRG